MNISLKKWQFNLIILYGIVGLAILILRCAIWFPLKYEVDLTSYINYNFIAGWVNAIYFTSIVFALVCLWLIVLGVAFFCKNEKLKNFALNKYVVLFIFTFQIFVAVIYTAFEGFNLIVSIVSQKEFSAFGWWANNFNSWRNFAEGIFMHYITTFVVSYLWKKAKLNSKLELKKCWWFYAFLAIYFAIVYFIGKYAFVVVWYPYLNFSSNILWQVITSSPYAWWLAVPLIVLINLVILTLFFVIHYSSIKEKNKSIAPKILLK